MDFKTQNNQQPQSAPARAAASPAPQGAGSRKLFAIISAVLALALIAGLAFAWQSMNSSKTGDAAIETDKYQALFMTNGQVYFGRLSNIDTGYAQLTDVYYLQVQQAVQPAADKKATDQPKVSLTKLGNELHGPTDKMHISRDQILFWENLKGDSTVVKAIKDFKNN